MEKKAVNKRVILVLIIGAIAIFGVTLGIIYATGDGGGDTPMTQQQAQSRLDKLLSNVRITEMPARKASVEYNAGDLTDELPDISKYPLSVSGGGAIDIEIVSSTEKAGPGIDGWLNEVAENFNGEGFNVNGKSVSVSVRPVSSGLAADYIIAGKHVPEVFSPSNQLWGEMIKSQSNVNIELKTDRIAGNVTGVLLQQSTYDEIEEKYGAVDIQAIVSATVEDSLAMGYTNPFASSTGMNFIISTLYSADAADPLSDKAIADFEAFQANVPFVAYTTIQMRDAAIKQNGVLDAMVLEYQTYTNTTELRDFVFVPFGVRHDNPVYAMGDLSADEGALLDMFIDYCLSEEAQALADEYGFNENESYKSEVPIPSGNVITSAQRLWKEVKDAGRPVAAVFVADVSGSMSGEPINNLKASLINAAQYINPQNLIGLISYDQDVYINLPVAEFDLNQRALFQGAVEDLSPNGSTATFDAVATGLKMLAEVKEADPTTKTMLFVLSDGETNKGHTLSQIQGVVEAFGTPIYTIGYNANLDELQKISTINEAASINADSDDVIYTLKNLFNAQM